MTVAFRFKDQFFRRCRDGVSTHPADPEWSDAGDITFPIPDHVVWES